MKCGQSQLDMTEMTIALLQSFTARLAKASLSRYTHPGVEGTIGHDCPILGGIIEISVTYF